MANQTHSAATTVNFDDASFLGLANGETFTVNGGGTLIINSDPQWAQNAAYLGTVQCDRGTVLVDGRSVRWLRVDNPTGTVPAVGTTVTGGSSGATGEVIGTWTAFPANAPAAGGAALANPSYLKLRTVTGAFTTGETVTGGNLSGGTANAPDSVGWLLVVQRDATGTSGGSSFLNGGEGRTEFRGEWFYLGTGNGTANQTFNHYTPDQTPFVEVETGSGSNAWVQFWSRADIIIKEAVSDNEPCFTQTQGSAVLTFDRRAVPNGARVRVPNIHLAATNATAWGTQTRVYSNNTAGGGLQAPFTTSGRPGIQGGNGSIYISKVIGAGYRFNPTSMVTFECYDSGFFGRSWVANIYGQVTIDGLVCCATDGTVGASNVWDQLNLQNGVTVSRLVAVSTAASNSGGSGITAAQLYDTGNSAMNSSTSTGDGALIKYAKDATYTNCRFLRIFGRLSGTSYGSASITDNNNITFTNCEFTGGSTAINRSTNISLINSTADKHAAGSKWAMFAYTGGSGTTPPAGTTFSGNTSGATGVVISHQGGATGNFGLNITSGTFGATEGLTFANGYTCTRSSYTYQTQNMFYLGSGLSRLRITGFDWSNTSPFGADGTGIIGGTSPGIQYARIRSIGSSSTPLSLLSKVPTAVVILQPSNDVKVQRCYFSNASSATPTIISNQAGCNEVTIDNIYHYSAQSQVASLSSSLRMRGLRLGGTQIVGSGNGFSNGNNFSAGFVWGDGWGSDTTGWLVIKPSQINSFSAPWVTNSGAEWNNSTGWVFRETNDQMTVEMDQFIYGHTGITGISNNLSSGGFTYEYQIDTGSGWSAWKTADNATLAAESISPTTGFKMKFRITNPDSSARTWVGSTIQTSSTLSAQNAALYPYANPPMKYTNVVSGSFLSAWRDSNETFESLGVEISGSATAYPSWNSDYSSTLRLRKPGYYFLEQITTVAEDGTTLIALQEDAGLPQTDPGALGITVTDHGASPVTWQGLPFSVTIKTTNDSLTAAQIANYINYNTSLNNTFQGKMGHSWHEMIIPDGSNYKTLRGKIIGGTGATLKGVRVVRNDETTAVLGFSSMQSDNGSVYTPPVSYALTLTGLVSGSEVRVFSGTPDNSTLLSSTESSSTSFTYNHTGGDIVGFIVVRKAEYKFIKLNVTFSSSDSTIPVTQILDPWYNNP